MASEPPEPDKKPENPFGEPDKAPKDPPVKKDDGGHGGPPHNDPALIYPSDDA